MCTEDRSGWFLFRPRNFSNACVSKAVEVIAMLRAVWSRPLLRWILVPPFAFVAAWQVTAAILWLLRPDLRP